MLSSRVCSRLHAVAVVRELEAGGPHRSVLHGSRRRRPAAGKGSGLSRCQLGQPQACCLVMAAAMPGMMLLLPLPPLLAGQTAEMVLLSPERRRMESAGRVCFTVLPCWGRRWAPASLPLLLLPGDAACAGMVSCWLPWESDSLRSSPGRASCSARSAELTGDARAMQRQQSHLSALALAHFAQAGVPAAETSSNAVLKRLPCTRQPRIPWQRPRCRGLGWARPSPWAAAPCSAAACVAVAALLAPCDPCPLLWRRVQQPSWPWTPVPAARARHRLGGPGQRQSAAASACLPVLHAAVHGTATHQQAREPTSLGLAARGRRGAPWQALQPLHAVQLSLRAAVASRLASSAGPWSPAGARQCQSGWCWTLCGWRPPCTPAESYSELAGAICRSGNVLQLFQLRVRRASSAAAVWRCSSSSWMLTPCCRPQRCAECGVCTK